MQETEFDGGSINVHDFDKIAIAIKMTCRERNQRHLGILLKKEPTSNIKFLHLAWHNDFRLDENVADGYYSYQACNGLIPVQIESFVDWLEVLWKKNQSGIPYGIIFNEEEMIFGDDGATSDFKPGQGFTCSSFVLECFKCFGLDLIKYNTWPVREEDKLWAEEIFYFLEGHAAEEHIVAQRANNDIVRFRPEEVAAAAFMGDFSSNIPLSFDEVEHLSKKIAKKVS